MGAEFLGAGASRTVYRISPRHVIKVEYNLYGSVSQNKQEVQKSDEHYGSNMITKCYWYHPKYVWIISEYAERIPDGKYDAYWEWFNDNKLHITNVLGITDIAPCNAGMINGRFVIIDSGLIIQKGPKK